MTRKTKKHSKRQQKRVLPELVGKVQLTREGFAFVVVEGQEEDVYVRPAKTRHALNGDIVKVVVTKDNAPQETPKSKAKGKGKAKAAPAPTSSSRKRFEGEIIQIIERSTKPFIGIYHSVGAQAWVLMQSRNMPYDIEVDAELSAQMGAQSGMKVSALVDGWPHGDICPSGHLCDVLGMPGDNDTEMHAILAEFNLPYRFDPELESAAEAIPEAITPEDLLGRRDMRDTLTFTIDPSDAKDFDDALSFSKLSNGNYQVGVHIADVCHYIPKGSIIDREARSRGTSVYLVDRTVPMLPEKLCNRLCSLREGEDKLVFSAVFEISPRASVKSRWIGRCIIRSDRRLDYDQAQEMIEAPKSSEANTPDAPLIEAIQTLDHLAKLLRKAARRAGAIDFDRPEMKVIVDEKGRPIDVHEHISKDSNSLIEQFMLLANRTVAEYIATCGKLNSVASPKAPVFVYRVHGEPNEVKLEGLRTFARGFGYKLDPTTDPLSGRGAAHSLNRLLEQAKGSPEFMAIETLALRSMAKAVYSTENIGHYGLAFKFYTHFTSPIRRYPDLMVHRLLEAYLPEGGGTPGSKLRFNPDQNREAYEQECKYASEREQIAADAERTSIKYKLVEFMQDKEGLEFDGSVSGLTDWGMYVEIEPTKIEGMIPLREIKRDFYEFDEKHYRLIGRRTRKTYRLGDKVRIRVKSAKLEQRMLDFELI